MLIFMTEVNLEFLTSYDKIVIKTKQIFFLSNLHKTDLYS